MHHLQAEFFLFNKEKNKDYVLLIPVVNEGNRLIRQLSKIKKYSKIVDVVVIDGKSTDGSTNSWLLKNFNVKLKILNQGDTRLGSQLRLGIFYALKNNYKGILLMDGNNKDDPSSIPQMINKLKEGYFFVQGSRFIKGGKHKNTPFIRYLSIRLIHSPICSLASGFWFTDSANGFKAFNRDFFLDKRVQPLRDVFKTYNLQCYLTIRAPQLGYKTIEIPVTRSYPKKGPVPTKIIGFKSYLSFLLDLIKAALGFYNVD
ncbi:MAG: glycosyltransferase family 2 protein [Patescibacteria group bacterium]|nr:glycosyltransferase family 2 protein [Patescibacteria group bacterium]